MDTIITPKPLLELQLNSCQFLAGELIQGSINLILATAASNLSDMQISLTFTGIESIKTQLTNTFINDTFTLHLKINKENLRYSVPFKIPLPNNLPCSLSFDHQTEKCEIYYEINAKLQYENYSLDSRKAIQIMTTALPVLYESHHFSDLDEVGCICGILCLICGCCRKDLAKLEMIMANEVHIGDKKIPLVLNVDNSLCRKEAKEIHFVLTKIVTVSGLSQKREKIFEKIEKITIEPESIKNEIIMNLQLDDVNQINCPTVYAKNIVCEYQLRVHLHYAKSCPCGGTGPEICVFVPVIDTIKQDKNEAFICGIEPILLKLNVAKIEDPYKIMKTTIN